MARAATGKRIPKSKGKAARAVRNDVPDVYRDMLADAISSPSNHDSEDGRATKRRRIKGNIITQRNDETASDRADGNDDIAGDGDLDELFEEPESTKQQIFKSESEDSADSDMDWEEVDLRDQEQRETPEHETKSEALELVLGGDEKNTRKQHQAKRKPVTATEKKLRLEVHKMHLCGLLAHVHLRNHWCNDEKVHSAMSKMLSKKILSYLNPDESGSQFQRSRSCIDGLTQVSDIFRVAFKVTARGMSKSKWADSPEVLALLQPPDDIDLPMFVSDFRAAAEKLKASRDVGVQLFCALLRSAGVDARLVCSLQPLPFQPSHRVTLSQFPHHAAKPPIQRSREGTPGQRSENDGGSEGSAFAEVMVNSTGNQTQKQAPQPSKRRPIRESKYPVYWVEAFNEAVQKWIPIDPLVTKSIAKPSKFEPPAGESENALSYVVAFEDDGYARDVTRRYAKSYNAKTRRERVEVTKGGEKWWRRAMEMYAKTYHLDRDQVEDAEFAAKEAAEPLPKNVQDFKDHPYYALERHLKRQEVIHPKREVGKLGAGKSGSSMKLEPIYRRRDVHLVKSADSWYRMGREIKPGEQPLKRVAARRPRERSPDADDLDSADDGDAGSSLYAAYQTTLYAPPPVFNGLIPKNTYGNLDVYVPSMVPPGGAHIKHAETARAARILGVDHADAVTGFVFKGRHGTAITNGAVVASEYKEAVEQVIKAFEDDRARVEEEKRSLEALRMWKRLLAGLRIRERIEGYNIEGERDETLKEVMEKIDDDEEYDKGDSGGFFPACDDNEIAQPTAGRHFNQDVAGVEGDVGGGFLPDDANEEQESDSNRIENDQGGRFMVDDQYEETEQELRDIRAQESDDEKSITTDRNATDDEGRVGGFTLDNVTTTAHKNDASYLDNDGYVPENNTHSSQVFSLSGRTLDSRLEIGSPSADRQVDRGVISDSLPAPEKSPPKLSSHEIEEARMLQQMYDADVTEQRIAIQKDTITNNETDQPFKQNIQEPLQDTSAGNLVAPSHASFDPASSHGSKQDEEDIAEAQNSSEDKGSLLSVDPDDEDADPEWLT